MKEKFKNIWQKIMYNYYSVVFNLGSIAFGINLFFNPFTIRHSEEELHILGLMLEHRFLAFLFVFFSLIKLIGIFKNNMKWRLIGLTALTSLWSFVMIGFSIRSYQGGSNYGTILTLIVIIIGFGVAIRGRFE